MATLLEKSCNGCGSKLGRKKYKFGALWKIPGLYCKECMDKLSKNFEKSTTGGLSISKHKCSSCANEFYFLHAIPTRGNKQFCNYCHDAIVNGGSMNERPASALSASNNVHGMPPQPVLRYGIPKSIYFAGASSIIIMAIGFVLTLTNMESGKEFTFFLGSIIALMGVILLRKFRRLTKRMIH